MPAPHTPDHADRPPLPTRVRVGAAMLTVQPAYIALEVLVGAAATSYSVLGDTISDLGTDGCGTGGICSPLYPVMNTTFVVFGLLRAAGAPLVRTRLPRGFVANAAVSLWVVSGLASVAVGLVPVDAAPTWHAIVAAPVFVAQPLAVLATALSVHSRRLLSRAGIAVGLVSGAAAVAFVATDITPGILERLAIWPAYVWLPFLAAAVLRRRTTG